MKIFRNSKKADLNLSVQAIVILIFAVIMLGLGLGLINFIFSEARGKVGQAISGAKLTNPPSADDSLTIESNINIKFKGESQVQIGYYNKNPDTKFNVEPFIKDCKTSGGQKIGINAMPTIATVAFDKVEPSGTAGWNAIIKLPDIDVEANAGEGEFMGALTAGQYICKISIYGTAAVATQPNFAVDLPLETDQFFLKVTT